MMNNRRRPARGSLEQLERRDYFAVVAELLLDINQQPSVESVESVLYLNDVFEHRGRALLSIETCDMNDCRSVLYEYGADGSTKFLGDGFDWQPAYTGAKESDTIFAVDRTGTLVVLSSEGDYRVAHDNVVKTGINKAELGTLADSAVYVTRTSSNDQVWVSDSQGNSALLLESYRGSLNPPYVTTVGEQVYFRLQAFQTGKLRELWKTDGTAAGTARVDAINVDKIFDPTELHAVGNTLFFIQQGNGISDLWKLDTTENAIGLVASDVTYLDISTPDSLSYRTRGDDTNSRWTIQELSDAPSLMPNPTRQLGLRSNELRFEGLFDGDNQYSVIGAGGVLEPYELPQELVDGTDNVVSWHATQTHLFVNSEPNGSLWSQIWVFDTAPTFDPMPRRVEIGPVVLSTAESGPMPTYAALGEDIYFLADDGIHGYELWKTDGTSQGTSLVKDINPGPNWGVNVLDNEHTFTVLNEQLMFAGRDDAGWSIWRSDGTDGGTDRLYSAQRVLTEGEFGLIFNLVALDDSVIFQLAGNRRGIGSSDGTVDGTFLEVGESAEVWYGWPRKSAGNQLLFLKRVSDVLELWTTNGSIAGTKRFFDQPVSSITSLQDRVYFVAENVVWKTDGTIDGTTILKETESPVTFVEKVGDFILFADWLSDGSPEGTVRLSGLHPTFDSDLRVIDGVGDRVWMQNGSQLWVTDGTPNGTSYVGDIGSNPAATIGALNDRFVFQSSATTWISDGTADGTLQIGSATNESRAWKLGNIDEYMIYVRESEIWVTDGTVEGTKRLVSDASDVVVIGETNDRLIVTINGEPWVLRDNEETIPGDADRNGKVDFADFLLLSSSFGKEVDALWADGDFDADGRVSFSDFLLMSANFGDLDR